MKKTQRFFSWIGKKNCAILGMLANGITIHNSIMFQSLVHANTKIINCPFFNHHDINRFIPTEKE